MTIKYLSETEPVRAKLTPNGALTPATKPRDKENKSILGFQLDSKVCDSAVLHSSKATSRSAVSGPATAPQQQFDNSKLHKTFDKDVARLLKYLHGQNSEELTETIRGLPPKVYEDLVKEVDHIVVIKMAARTAGDFFDSANRIALSENDLSAPEALTHEIGHAIDSHRKDKTSNEYYSSAYLQNIFQEELQTYKSQGGKLFTAMGGDEYYFANDPAELFAEVYAWRYFPEHRPEGKKAAYKHFPQTVKTIEAYLDSIDKVPANFRKNNVCDVKYDVRENVALPVKEFHKNGNIKTYECDKEGFVTRQTMKFGENSALKNDTEFFSNGRLIGSRSTFKDGTVLEEVLQFDNKNNPIGSTRVFQTNNPDGLEKMVMKLKGENITSEVEYFGAMEKYGKDRVETALSPDGTPSKVKIIYKDGTVETIDCTENGKKARSKPSNDNFTGRIRS